MILINIANKPKELTVKEWLETIVGEEVEENYQDPALWFNEEQMKEFDKTLKEEFDKTWKQ